MGVPLPFPVVWESVNCGVRVVPRDHCENSYLNLCIFDQSECQWVQAVGRSSILFLAAVSKVADRCSILMAMAVASIHELSRLETRNSRVSCMKFSFSKI